MKTRSNSKAGAVNNKGNSVSRNSTDNRRFKCSHCDFRTHFMCNIRKHERLHTEPGSHVCSFPGCTYRTHFLDNLKAHTRRRHPQTLKPEDIKWYSCSKCEFREKEAVVLKRHAITHGKIKPFYCSFPQCKFRSHWKSAVYTHERRQHRPELKNQFACSYPACDYKSYGKSDMEVHEMTHKTARLFPCPFPGCDYKAKLAKWLRGHENIHDPDRKKEKQCLFCADRFFNFQALQTHIKAHLGEKPYQCSFPNCSVKRVYKSSITAHERTHRDEKNYSCNHDGCTYKTKSAASLTVHKDIHRSDRVRSHECALCLKKFFTKGTLQIHMGLHSQERHYQCPACDYATPMLSNLKRHRCFRENPDFPLPAESSSSSLAPDLARTDGSSAPVTAVKKKFQCELCDFVSKYTNKVKDHLLEVHIEKLVGPRATEKRKYKCRECERTFKDIPKVKRHARVHSTDRPFKCTFSNNCEFRSRLKTQLQRHLKTEHKVLHTKYCEECHREVGVSGWGHHVKSHLTNTIVNYVPTTPLTPAISSVILRAKSTRKMLPRLQGDESNKLVVQ